MVFKFFIFLLEPPVFQPGKPSDFLSLWHQGLSGEQNNVWWLGFLLLMLLLLFCFVFFFVFVFLFCFILFFVLFLFCFVLLCFGFFFLFFVFVFLIYFQVLASNKLNFFLLLISFPAEVSSPRCL